MSAPPPPAGPAAFLPAAVLRRLAALWLLFCAVKIGSAVLFYHLDGGRGSWQPLLWEGSSLLVVTLLGTTQLRTLGLWRHLPDHPWRWFGACLAWLPAWCVVFVSATFALRFAVYALVGESYRPGPWLRVATYESITLAIFYVLWLGVIFGLVTRDRLTSERRRAADIANALREAQLALLRQQLQPHFLFNALNLISATMYEDVARADALLRKLAALLRQAAAQTTQALQSLDDELALMRDYGDIMAARFEGRVDLSWRISEPLPATRVPSMVAQPLLENAFKYGVEPYAAGCRIEIGVSGDTARILELTITQNRGRCQESACTDGSHAGQGIANVRQRLAAHYGDGASLEIVNLEPEGVCARLALPCAS